METKEASSKPNQPPRTTGVHPAVVAKPESEGVAALKSFMAQHGAGVADMSGDPAPTADLQPMVSPPVERQLEEAAAALSKAPEKTYRERLKEAGISFEEAMQIVDAVFVRGFYEKTYRLSQRASVTLRTRTVENHEQMLQQVEEERPSYSMTAGQIMSRNNLADSLVRLTLPSGAVDLSGYTRKQRLDYVSSLAGPAFAALVSKLVQFDRLTMTALDTGAEENF